MGTKWVLTHEGRGCKSSRWVVARLTDRLPDVPDRPFEYRRAQMREVHREVQGRVLMLEAKSRDTQLGFLVGGFESERLVVTQAGETSTGGDSF